MHVALQSSDSDREKINSPEGDRADVVVQPEVEKVPYENERDAQIARNNKRLQELGMKEVICPTLA